jgi:hypothetical protein
MAQYFKLLSSYLSNFLEAPAALGLLQEYVLGYNAV